MKYTFVFAFCLLAITSTFAQDLNQKVMDDQSKKEILIGYCDRSGLMVGDFGNSYNIEWNTYIPDNDALNGLKYKLDDMKFTVILGTWCSDSKTQVPRFIRLLDCLKYDVEKVTFIAVDRTKTAGTVPTADFKIEKVPTIIVSMNGKELGRIVETPAVSLEKDLLNIIEKK
jgi:hypothetical protein